MQHLPLSCKVPIWNLLSDGLSRNQVHFGLESCLAVCNCSDCSVMLLKDMLIPSEITYSSFCCRYTYNMLARMGIHYLPLTWLNFSLCILLYPLSVLAKAFAICVSLPYFETFGTYSVKLPFPFAFSVYFPYVLKMYLLVLFTGMCFIIRNLFSERKAHLETGNSKKKSS